MNTKVDGCRVEKRIDASKAKKQLNWEPKVLFNELATMMVDADLDAERERLNGTKHYIPSEQR